MVLPLIIVGDFPFFLGGVCVCVEEQVCVCVEEQVRMAETLRVFVNNFGQK